MKNLLFVLCLLVLPWTNAQAQIPQFVQKAGDTRTAEKFLQDCAAGIQADSCLKAPTPKGCGPGRKWSLAGSGVAHCVADDFVCPVGVLVHDFLGNPSCDTTPPPPPPPVTPPAPVCTPKNVLLFTSTCPAGSSGGIDHYQQYTCDGAGNLVLSSTYQDDKCVADPVPPVTPPGVCVPSDIQRSSTPCANGTTGGPIVIRDVVSCPGSVASTITTGVCSALPACPNGATNYPTCSLPVCPNGATNYPTCTLPVTPPEVCLNGASNYPTCTFPEMCWNGATNYPTCSFTCPNGATNYPTCTLPVIGPYCDPNNFPEFGAIGNRNVLAIPYMGYVGGRMTGDERWLLPDAYGKLLSSEKDPRYSQSSIQPGVLSLMNVCIKNVKRLIIFPGKPQQHFADGTWMGTLVYYDWGMVQGGFDNLFKMVDQYEAANPDAEKVDRFCMQYGWCTPLE